MKRVFNLIIVDESGSMSIIEKQALMGLNETLETVKKMQQLHPDMEQRVTLITFDSSHKRYIFDNVPTSSTHKLTRREYRPGGATPLYDAIGLGISKLNAQTTVDDNVLVTIITDGEENCSEEYNLQMVKTLIEKLKKQNPLTITWSSRRMNPGQRKCSPLSATHVPATMSVWLVVFPCQRAATSMRTRKRVKSGNCY